MKHSKITALALTGAMLAGTFATATPVLAGRGIETNDVSCTANGASYTMVIPTSVTVANSGYNTLGDGITIKNLANADKVKSIEVTASSENAWKLKKDDNNTITYNLCESAESTGAITDNKLSFTEKTAMADTDGSTKTCGINVSDYSEAEAGDYSDTITWTATAVEYTGLTLDKTSCTLYKLTDSCTLNATVDTADVEGDAKNLTWKSSNSDIATVDQNGKITPVANGNCKITVSTGSYSATCNVTVAMVTGLTLSKNSITLGGENKSGEIYVTAIEPGNAQLDFSDLQWSSNDEDTINVQGIMEYAYVELRDTKESKVCTVTVSLISNPEVKATCTVYVGDATTATLTGISFDEKCDTYVGKSTDIVTNFMHTTPDGFSVKGSDFTYKITEGSDIATVTDDGCVTATKAGTVKVLVTYKEDTNVTAEITLMVHEMS